LQKFRYCFDTLGGDYTFDAFEVIKEGGRVTTIAGPPDEETAKHMGMNDYKLSEKLLKLIEKRLSITWMQPDAEQLNTISRMVEDGDIKPIIDLIYSIEDAVDISR
jgi:NADPH:quinone reductase-like Zn-dependent oxidoreductase